MVPVTVHDAEWGGCEPEGPMNVDIVLQDGMKFEARGEDGLAVALDAASEHGGLGSGFRPLELLLVGLGSCTAMDVISILRKKRQKVTGYRIAVSAEQRTDEYPHVFTHVTVHHIIAGQDVAPEAVRRAIELSENKYCPAYAMLSQAVPISSTWEIQNVAGSMVSSNRD